MKKLATKEVAITNLQSDMKSTKEWISQTLKNIHKKMRIYHVNFACINDVKIIRQSELLNQITQRMRDDLRENGVVYTDIQWKQICEILSKNQVAGFFENFAFYNPKDDVMYLNEDIIRTHPEKMIIICAHELAEKLLTTYISPTLETPIQATVKLHIEAKKNDNSRKFYKLLNIYVDTVFRNVFKEGCCEAIALQTLRSMGYEVASWENELQTGHSKCIGLLSCIDNARKSEELLKEDQMRQPYERRGTKAMYGLKLVKEILRSSQIIKAVSYYLGYPVAKVVLEKYGIEGLKLAIEKNPPLKAQYFADSQTYQTELEIISKGTKERR